MKKYLRTVFALLLSLSLITTLSYASAEDKSQKIDNYSIESLEELKAEIKEKNLGLSKTDEKYLKARTNPKVLEEFLKENQGLQIVTLMQYIKPHMDTIQLIGIETTSWKSGPST